ncbi:lanthionine synthetase C family protein [Streptomyces sp. NPDC053474]|uniref:lanthionine synthetase C family protein n=1 Tax=Streptomyces sp. NPDC053474 TaxID=3365704 RepID=UPI0037D45F32
MTATTTRTIAGNSAARAQSLSQGAIGIALAHVERAHHGADNWHTAHAAITATTRHPLIASDQAALFLGAPAVAFVLHTAAAGTDRYAGALRNLDTTVTNLTRRRLAAAHARIDRAERPRPAEYDLLYGLTGLGAYLLQRNPASEPLHDVLTYLVRLTEPLPGDKERLPGWWTYLDPTNRVSEAFPGGHGNVGIAHGITGPLALLSLALRHGTVVRGHMEAIERICSWLDTFRQETDTGTWWPQWITRAEQRSHTATQPGPLRPSWCYGTPGVARSLQLAALALHDTARQRMAEDALLWCVSSPAQLSLITSPGLCHGAAGLLLTTARVAQDAQRPELTAHLTQLRELLLAQAPAREDGLLQGRTGGELAALTDPSTSIPTSGWDACLLLT